MIYNVVRASSLYELTDKVNKKIKQGWEPFGGVSCISGDVQYIQAIVKKE